MGRGGSGVTPRGNGFQIAFQFRGVTCRETLKIDNSKKANYKFATGLKQEIDRRIALGTFDYQEYFPNSKRASLFCGSLSSKSVSKALEEWLEGKKKTTAKSTLESYESGVKCHLVPHLGDYKIKDLATSHVRQMIALMDVSNKRINNVLIPLRGMLGDAYADGAIKSNPMDRIKNLKICTREPSPFDKDEQAAIVEASRVNDILFCFWTGLRIGELIALKWSDIDLIKGTAYINRNNVRGDIKETKTEAGTRVIELLPPALEALKAQKLLTYLKGEEVFNNPNTRLAWNDDITFRRMWVTTLKRSGVRYREPKQMRHTYASMMLTAGENIAWVSRQIGHTSITTTLKRYARYIPQENHGAGGKAVEMFAKSDGNRTIIAHKKRDS